MKAGAVMSEVEDGTRRVLVNHLLDMGLVKGNADDILHKKVDRVFMPHGISHHLGLDVHDMSRWANRCGKWDTPRQLSEELLRGAAAQ